RLVINLGMTGRVVTTDAPRAAEMRHVAVRFELDDGRAILYDDIRRFGCLDLRDAEGWHRSDAELRLEPLSDAFTPEALWALPRGDPPDAALASGDAPRGVGIARPPARRASGIDRQSRHHDQRLP